MQFQDCYQDEYGNVIFTYKDAELVRVSCCVMLAVQQSQFQNLTSSGLQVSRAGDVTINGQGHTLNAVSNMSILRAL